MQRRHFLTGAATALAAGRAIGANDRVVVALIGCGGRGRYVASQMKLAPGAEFGAVCDVYRTNAEKGREMLNPQARVFGDMRRLLELKEIDAVMVSTPDHWHANGTVLACQAGKDVYVEKPLAHNVREGRAMVRAAREYKRIVQVGTQHRSAGHLAEIGSMIRSGALGEVRFVRVWNYSNIYPRGIGDAPDSAPPEGLEWDQYLGPAPTVPFNEKRFLGTFRQFWDYAGGTVTDYGTHRFDSVHEIMGEEIPLSVTASGHRYALKGAGEMPDVVQITYEYPSFVMSYEACNLNGHGTGIRTAGMRYYNARGTEDHPNGMAFYGTKGTVVCERIDWEVFPEPGSGLQRVSKNAPEPTPAHARKFIENVRARKTPEADVEVGHRATIVGHLGNIAYKTGRKLKWDGVKEEIAGDPEANALLGRSARKQWDFVKFPA